MLSLRRAASLVLAAVASAGVARGQSPPASPGEPIAPAPPARADAQSERAPAPAPVPALTRLKLGAFVDVYYAHDWRAPSPASAPITFRAFDSHKGFDVAWVGLDAAIEPEPVGFVGQLRFGSATPALAQGDASGPAAGLSFVQQAYAAYRPGGANGRLTLIAGKFDTVYGHEVAQSHLNINYTRGVLFNLGQPFFHTGLRADYRVSEQLVVKLLAVNGWNASVDVDAGKSFGVSATLTPADSVAVTAGYLGGPEQSDTITIAADPTTTPPTAARTASVAGANSRLRHLVDVVVDVRPTDPLRLVANGTFVTERVLRPGGTEAMASWYGVELIVRHALGERLAAAARGEYFVDDRHGAPTGGLFTGRDGAPAKASLATGTLTLEAAPNETLLVRLENRVDHASQRVFADGLTGRTREQLTTTVGVVVKTD